MDYLCIYEDGNFRTYDACDFKEGEEYFLGFDQDNYLDIGQDLEFLNRNRIYGKITSRYRHLYYTELFYSNPTYINNQRIFDETFPLLISGKMCNVFSFMDEKGYPFAFIFLSNDEAQWKEYEMEPWHMTIGGSIRNSDQFLENTPPDFMTFTFVEGSETNDACYYLSISEEAREDFWMINDNNMIAPLEENMRLELKRTYRFLYDDRYMFIIGGAVILYAKL